jgi:nucleotide-binding universal stress UspA family protein
MNILVPFDVKPVSRRAAEAALNLFSGNEDAHITAVHFSTGEDTPAEIAASEVESMGDEYEVSVESDIQVIDHGAESKAAIRTAITETIADNDIDLVVLGHEEKSLFEEIFRSDTSERVLEIQEIPVLLVP